MCRYAFAKYKPHYACFECRVIFKRRLPVDIKKSENSNIESRCPQCRNLIADMGLDFKSPKMGDVIAWNHIMELYSIGFTFHSCGCMGPGFVPKDTGKSIEYLGNKLNDFISNRSFWINKVESKFQQKKKKNGFELGKIPDRLKDLKGEISSTRAIKFWNGKIKEIGNKMNELRAIN